MVRKQRRPTPNFKIPPPFNPISGKYEDLKKDGIYPYCAMMQVAKDDVYDDYVVCRGFDTRIFRFVDFKENSSVSPGISVAKPFGSRGGTGSFRVGQIFPAFLPTQGVSSDVFSYVPPSPSEVQWRIGQNPGVVDGGTNDGGHPETLTDNVSVMYDHNNKVVNWMFIHASSDAHFRFQSRAELSGVSCEACVRQMDGSDAHIAQIYDPDGIFTGMDSGTKGLVFFQGGKYYIVQAKCNSDVLLSCS